MALVEGKSTAFGADLKRQLTSRTSMLMAVTHIPVGEKLKKLDEVIGRDSDFNIDATLSAIERAARERTVVAAMVVCPVVPVMDGIFLGFLDPENPLELDSTGSYRINVVAGQIARVFTTRAPRDGGKFQVASRFTVRGDEPDPITVQHANLLILENEVYKGSTSFTSHADDVLGQAAGLDYKIVHERTNLPRVESNGDILETYDRMNVVKGLGENTFRAMWASVTQPA